MRKESGVTQEQVAAVLEWSASKLIRVEGGKSSVTKVDLDALLDQYKITSESIRDRLQALNRGAREPAWWDRYKDDVAPAYIKYVGYEAGAAFIRQFESMFVPGLLQTPEYAEAVTSHTGGSRRPGSVVSLRLQRQDEMAQRSPQPRRYYVVDEAVIRRRVGISTDPGIMPMQLRKIANTVETDDLLTIRVIPFEAGAHRGLPGPFTLLEFEGGLPDALYVDAGLGAFARIVTGADDQIAEYQDDFEALLEDALSAAESIELIRSTAEEMS
jgi:transcriptional regulator with XRE-family HTH domain